MRRYFTCPGWAQDSDLPPFTKELLDNPGVIKEGKEVFGKICKFCHGETTYLGKAPKLHTVALHSRVRVRRVTNGFRGMASFKEQFTDKERQAVMVFIMSKEFSN